MRIIASAIAALSLLAVSAAQTYTGTLEVAFGHYQDAQGVVHNLKGLKLPYTATKIESKTVKRSTSADRLNNWLYGKKSGKVAGKGPGGGGGAEAVQTIYHADQQAAGSSLPYGVIGDFDSPSVVDDITPLAGGIGKPWKFMTFGFDTVVANPVFLCRWTLMNNYATGRGPGVSAFDPFPVPASYPLDFGVVWNQAVPVGTYKVTIDVSSAGVYSPIGLSTFWFWQQFRQVTTPVNPDAPYDTTIANVFNQEVAPQVGSSSDFFWFDWSPMEGIIDDDEKDTFTDENNNQLRGNLLLKLDANITGTFLDVNVTGITPTLGSNTNSGSFFFVWLEDTFNYEMAPNYNVNRNAPNITLELTGTSTAQTVDTFGGIIKSTCVSGGGTQRLSLWRYRGASPGWVVLNTATTTVGSGPNTSVLFNWTAGNPSDFIQPGTGTVKAKLDFFVNPTSGRSFRYKLDQFVWKLVTP
jgi:hypothetical protein